MWYQNAIVVLEIVSSLFGMGRRGNFKGEGEEGVIGLEVVRAGLFEGVKMYCRDIENRQLF